MTTAPDTDEMDLGADMDADGFSETQAWKQSGERPSLQDGKPRPASMPPPPPPARSTAVPAPPARASSASLPPPPARAASMAPLTRTVVSLPAPPRTTSLPPVPLPPPRRMEAGPAPAPGDVIDGKYKVERVLGSGGMGIVLVAKQVQLDRRVAIKLLLPDALKTPEIVARFAREARAAAKIQSEHVARIIDVDQLPNGAPYLVMEYLEGADLGEVIKDGNLSVPEAVECILHACEALAEAHAAGIVHRDIKPANLFLTKRADGSRIVKVLDFGISKYAEMNDGAAEMTMTQVSVGSPLYMSPEQVTAARDVDARSDVWGLGATLFRLLTGRSAFDAPSMAEIHVKILSHPTPLLGEFGPPELQQIIVQCLEKKREKRFQSVALLAQALAPFGPAGSDVSVRRTASVLQAAPKPIEKPEVVVERVASKPPARAAVPVPAASEIVASRSQTFSTRAAEKPRSSAKTALAVGLGIAALAVAGGVGFLASHSTSARPDAIVAAETPGAARAPGATQVAVAAPVAAQVVAPVGAAVPVPAVTPVAPVATQVAAPAASPAVAVAPAVPAAAPAERPRYVAPVAAAPVARPPSAAPPVAPTPAAASPATQPKRPKSSTKDDTEFGDRK